MTRDEAMQHCQAYLDGQLDPALAAEVKRLLEQDAELREMFESEREFNQLVGRLSRRAAAPATLEQGVRTRLTSAHAAASSTAPAPVLRPGRWRGWKTIAAGVALVVLAGLLYSRNHRDECPYMIACTREHALVAQGKIPLQEKTDKPEVLAKFVSDNVKKDIARLPIPEKAQLQPFGAGISKFESLKQYQAPDGVFVAMNSPSGTITLLFHPWAEEEPANFNRLQYKGGTYWATRHNGVTVAAWRNEERKLVLSVVSAERSKDELLELASQMRGMLSENSSSAQTRELYAALEKRLTLSRRP
jgi:hypothetical protein